MSVKRLAAMLVFGMFVTACASTEPEAAPTSAAPATGATAGDSGEATGSTTAPPATEGSKPAPAPEPDSDRPLAPDFELTLGDGGTFALSAETKPVYLVFWAEW
jgi:hypothetical protein